MDVVGPGMQQQTLPASLFLQGRRLALLHLNNCLSLCKVSVSGFFSGGFNWRKIISVIIRDHLHCHPALGFIHTSDELLYEL